MSEMLVIHTSKDGQLAEGQTADDVAKVAAELAGAERAVIHFHGGLHDRALGMSKAEMLNPFYRSEAGAVPAFFVWGSDLSSVLKNNLDEVRFDKFFGSLWGKAKARFDDALQAIELRPPDEESDALREERKKLEAALREDPEFKQLWKEIADGAAQRLASLGGDFLGKLLSPELLEELKDDLPSLDFAPKLFRPGGRAGDALDRAVRRILDGRGHGRGPTLVEELFREYYMAAIPAELWRLMKKETADTFVPGGPGIVKGGRVLVDELGARLAGMAEADWPELTLVGHSAGSTFLLNMLRDVERRRRDPSHAWPAGFAFENVVFLAPACDFREFRPAVEDYPDLFLHFRMFTMTDEKEAEDAYRPGLYDRSLLYVISGVLEKESDWPIVGMQRYYTDEKTYRQPEVQVARRFIRADDSRAVWSITEDRGDGLRSNSTRHGDFDLPEQTSMQSVAYMIRHGAKPKPETSQST